MNTTSLILACLLPPCAILTSADSGTVNSSALEQLLDTDDRPPAEEKPDPEILALVRNVITYSGLEMNFTLVSKPGIRNAYAKVEEGRRILAYDSAYLGEIAEAADTDWARLGVLAHEIGHHLQGHLVDEGHQREDELAADRYAAFVLGLMGASLEQAQSHQTLLRVEGNETHPIKSDRLEATRQGWSRAQTLVVKRDVKKDCGCPIIRLDRPAQREAVFALALNGEFVATKLVLKWGHDGIVWGSYEASGAMRKVTGHIERDGALRLEQFSGCVVLGKFDLKQSGDNRSNETWTGTCTPQNGKPFSALLVSALAPPKTQAQKVKKKSR